MIDPMFFNPASVNFLDEDIKAFFDDTPESPELFKWALNDIPKKLPEPKEKIVVLSSPPRKQQKVEMKYQSPLYKVLTDEHLSLRKRFDALQSHISCRYKSPRWKACHRTDFPTYALLWNLDDQKLRVQGMWFIDSTGTFTTTSHHPFAKDSSAITLAIGDGSIVSHTRTSPGGGDCFFVDHVNSRHPTRKFLRCPQASKSNVAAVGCMKIGNSVIEIGYDSTIGNLFDQYHSFQQGSGSPVKPDKSNETTMINLPFDVMKKVSTFPSTRDDSGVGGGIRIHELNSGIHVSQSASMSESSTMSVLLSPQASLGCDKNQTESTCLNSETPDIASAKVGAGATPAITSSSLSPLLRLVDSTIADQCVDAHAGSWNSLLSDPFLMTHHPTNMTERESGDPLLIDQEKKYFNVDNESANPNECGNKTRSRRKMCSPACVSTRSFSLSPCSLEIRTCVAAALYASIQKSPQSLSGATGPKKDEDCLAVSEIPPITNPSDVNEFMTKIYKCVQYSPECNIVALIYIRRAEKLGELDLNMHNWRAWLLVAFIIAEKFWSDECLATSAYQAIIPELTKTDLHKLELNFYDMVQFSLLITPELYDQYLKELRSLFVLEIECSCSQISRN